MTNPPLVKDVVEMVEKKERIDFPLSWKQQNKLIDHISSLPISEDKLREQGYIKLDSVELNQHETKILLCDNVEMLPSQAIHIHYLLSQSLPQLLKRKVRR